MDAKERVPPPQQIRTPEDEMASTAYSVPRHIPLASQGQKRVFLSLTFEIPARTSLFRTSSLE